MLTANAVSVESIQILKNKRKWTKIPAQSTTDAV